LETPATDVLDNLITNGKPVLPALKLRTEALVRSKVTRVPHRFPATEPAQFTESLKLPKPSCCPTPDVLRVVDHTVPFVGAPKLPAAIVGVSETLNANVSVIPCINVLGAVILMSK
jgi:hypothetical protein